MDRRTWAPGFGGYLLALVGLLVAQPLIVHFQLGEALYEAAVTLTLVVGAVGASRHRRERIVVAILAGVTVALRWGAFAAHSGAANEAGHGAALVFFALTAVLVLRAVLEQSEVTFDALYGAVNVYLLVAVCWAMVFQLVELHMPGSFAANGGPMAVRGTGAAVDFTYFSLVTMATLGYGDIVPVSPIARTLAVLEVVFAQFYVAILIGRLLGLHLQRRRA